jgi:hypothetical protein
LYVFAFCPSAPSSSLLYSLSHRLLCFVLLLQ